MRVLWLLDALVLAVVAVVGVEGVARVLVLHGVRLALGRAVGGRRVLVAVAVAVGVVLVALLVVGHPAGAVHGLEAALTAAARVDATAGEGNVSRCSIFSVCVLRQGRKNKEAPGEDVKRAG